MPFKDKQAKADHNKAYKRKNSELLTIERIIRLKHKTITQTTYDRIKPFVEDESFWENVTVRKSKIDTINDKIVSYQKTQNVISQQNTYRVVDETPTTYFKEISPKPGFIYLICEREFIKTNEKIYKIGKTINIKNRMPSYPKDSLLYLCFYCDKNIDTIEKNLISSFNLLFLKRTDIGAEYYEGDVKLMIKHMMINNSLY